MFNSIMNVIGDSLESITLQVDSPLRKELISKINEIKNATALEHPQDRNYILDKLNRDNPFNDIVYRHTGIKVNTTLDLKMSYNACIMVPDMNNWHAENIKQICKHLKNNAISGIIDYGKGMVKGEFTKMPFDLFISAMFFKTDVFTSEQIAAIILHEIGHAWDFFDTLTRALQFNYSTYTYTLDYNNATDRAQRVAIINDYAKDRNIKVKVEELANNEKGEEVIIVMASKSVNDKRSTISSYGTNARMIEIVADQFASRHGAGKDLVKALHVLHEEFGVDLTIEYSVIASAVNVVISIALPFIFLTMIGLTGPAIFLAALSALTHTILFLSIPSMHATWVYDPPKLRFERIRNNMVQFLKSKNVPEKVKKKIAIEIEETNKIIKTIVENETVHEFIYRKIFKSYQKELDELNFQRELEQLITNNLFTKATLLRGI